MPRDQECRVDVAHRLLRLAIAAAMVTGVVLPIAAKVARPLGPADRGTHATSNVTRPSELPDHQSLTAGKVTRPQAAAGPRFEVSFAATARAEAVTGRVYVAISRDNQRPPIQQAGQPGVPLFSKRGWARRRARPAVIDATDFGHPLQSLRDLPAGRVLGAAVRERLHAVRARGRPHRLAAHGPVGGAAVEPLARQPLRRPGQGAPGRTTRRTGVGSCATR